MDTYYPIKHELEIEGICAFYYRENGRDFYFKDAQRESWRFIYVDKGEVSISADNSSYFLRQGDMIFHEPLEVHALASNGKDLNRILICDFNAVGGGMEKFRNKVYALNPYQQDLLKTVAGEASAAFEVEGGMLKLKDSPDRFAALQLTAISIERLFIDLIRFGKIRSANRKSSSAKRNIEIILAQSVEEYMKEHIKDNISLEEICRYFHAGKTYLSEVFKGQTGHSIMDYYVRIKNERAKELLEEGQLNVTQVAAECGFSSIHHFTRSFKAHTGTTPREYAKKNA